MVKKYTLIVSPCKGFCRLIFWGLRPVVRTGLVLCSGAHEGFPHINVLAESVGVGALRLCRRWGCWDGAAAPGGGSAPRCTVGWCSFSRHVERNKNQARQVIWYKGLSKLNCSSLKKEGKKENGGYLPTTSFCQASWGITSKRNPSVKPWWLRRKIFTHANSTVATFIGI